MNSRFPSARRVLRQTCAAAAVALACVAAAAADAPTQTIARIGDTVITQEEFDAAVSQAARSKFYHGKVPDGAMAALQREVSQQMVDDLLLLREAKRRRLQPDQAAIKRTVDGYDERYATSEQWKANRARMLPQLKAKLERESLMDQLTRQVKANSEPSARDLQEYWSKHKDKFTSPEEVRLGMILLRVDPSSPQAKWDGAKAEGAAIVKRLRGGADFAQLAQLHSGDASAERGGDLGFVHQGMLPEPAQQAVDKMRPGDTSDAVVLLEGVAVFRLADRKPPKLNPLDVVRERARDLWVRDKGDEAWSALLAKLRRDTPVRFDESRFLTSATAAAPQTQSATR